MISDFEQFFISLKKKTRTWNLYTLAIIKRYKYWDKLLSLAFKYSSRCYQRKGPLQIEKLKNPSKELKFFSDNFGRFSSAKTLLGQVTLEEEDIQTTKNLLICAYNKVKSPKLNDLASCEILAKVMAYRNLTEGVSFQMGYIDDEGMLKLTTYTVTKVFDLWHKHVAFGLTSNSMDAAPILLYRGTDFSIMSEGGRASIISDLDPEGPGRRLFFNSKSVIRKWLQKQCSLGKKPRSLGFSLGGVLSTYTALYENDMLSTDENSCSYSFNPPGVSEELLDEWDAIEPSERAQFKTFVTRGDLISKFGCLVGDAYEVSTDKPLSPVIAHEHLIFSQPISYLIKIDNEKENLSDSRQYYSNIQKQTTSIAYRFGLKYLFPNPFDV